MEPLSLVQKDWKVYNEWAWIEKVLASPESAREETELYCRMIQSHGPGKSHKILHLASGAGLQDATFKKYFQVTGVDLSGGMLEIARERNPEVTYIQGDMRNVRIDQTFDAVVIPDSIGYITNLEDLRRVFETASRHLETGGVLLITTHTKEEFRENNFVYHGACDSCRVTLFENNAFCSQEQNHYEATMVFLVREEAKLRIYTERHLLGLYPLNTWLSLYQSHGFLVKSQRMDELYRDYLMEEGEYPLTLFVGTLTSTED